MLRRRSATLDANRGKPGSNSWVVRPRAWCASRLRRNGLGYCIAKRVIPVLCLPERVRGLEARAGLLGGELDLAEAGGAQKGGSHVAGGFGGGGNGAGGFGGG